MAKSVVSQPVLRYVAPEQLDFDPSNPRFGGLMQGQTPEQIKTELMGEPYFASELIDSLLANGFIDYEPLVVKETGSNRYIVVEGNRRLAAIKEIRSNLAKYDGRKKSDLDFIPVLIFPKKPDAQQQNEMRVYLGVRHLLGFREWPPASKAQYLERESQATSLEQVLKETRLTKAQARRFLIPFRILAGAAGKLPKGEDFWVLGEALQRTGVKKFIQLEVNPDDLQIISYDKKNLSVLLDYLYGPKKAEGGRNSAAKVVSDTRDVSRLSKVLGEEKAAAVLRAGKTLEEAEIYVDTKEESVKRLIKVSRELGVLVKKLTSASRTSESQTLTTTYKAFEVAVKNLVSKNS